MKDLTISSATSGLSLGWRPCKLSTPRLQTHLLIAIPKKNSTSKNPDDIVITYATRTPLTKAFKGGLKDTPVDFMLLQLFKVRPLHS